MEPPVDPSPLSGIDMLPPYQSPPYQSPKDQNIWKFPEPEAQNHLLKSQVEEPLAHWRFRSGPSSSRNSGRPIRKRPPRCPNREPPAPPKIQTSVSHVAILGTGPETVLIWNAVFGKIWTLQTQVHQGNPTKLTILIQVNGREVVGLVDLGCAQTLVRSTVVY